MASTDLVLTCLRDLASPLRIDRHAPLDPATLAPEPRIRKLCEDNLCGNFGRHPQCPPQLGTLDQATARLRAFRQGLLFQTAYEVDARDVAATRLTQQDHQRAALALEAAARDRVDPRAEVLVGGPCVRCDPACPALDGAPCEHPALARPSLEALGVDVVALQQAVGWDAAFRDDRVTWTGALLWDPGR